MARRVKKLLPILLLLGLCALRAAEPAGYYHPRAASPAPLCARPFT